MQAPGNHHFQNLHILVGEVSHRALLRAMHFFNENARAQAECKALQNSDMDAFLRLVNASGKSSYQYLQNVYSFGNIQPVSFALAVTEKVLAGSGAVRVHGGGFAGTIQAYLPVEKSSAMIAEIEKFLGTGCCEILKISQQGAGVIIK